MTSPEAAAARATLTREVVDPAATFTAEREGWDRAMRDVPLPPEVSELELAVGGVPARVITPPGARACAVHFHGGGLVAGSSLTHRPLAALLARETGLAIVLPDYRVLPEHTAAQTRADAVAAIGGAAHATGLELAGVGGDSNGAGLAMAALAAGAQAPALYSVSGAFDARLRSASIDALAAADPVLTPAALRDWRDRLASAGVDLTAPALSPLDLALGDLPRTLLLAGSDELWRDDSRRAHVALAAAGVTVTSHEYPGMWHVWPAWTDLPESVAAARRIGDWLVPNRR